jgi:hypothetical protein
MDQFVDPSSPPPGLLTISSSHPLNLPLRRQVLGSYPLLTPADIMALSSPTPSAFHPMSVITATMSLITVISIISSSSRQVLGSYPLLTPADIMALCLDNRYRKFIVGDSQGNVNVSQPNPPCMEASRRK